MSPSHAPRRPPGATPTPRPPSATAREFMLREKYETNPISSNPNGITNMAQGRGRLFQRFFAAVAPCAAPDPPHSAPFRPNHPARVHPRLAQRCLAHPPEHNPPPCPRSVGPRANQGNLRRLVEVSASVPLHPPPNPPRAQTNPKFNRRKIHQYPQTQNPPR